jgi:hypothetical protein
METNTHVQKVGKPPTDLFYGLKQLMTKIYSSNYKFFNSQLLKILLVGIHQSGIEFRMEGKAAEAIRSEDISTLEEIIKNGFNVNMEYKYPIGCVRLFHDSPLKGCKIISFHL